MLNVGNFYFLNKHLVLSTQGGIIKCQQLLFPGSVVVCLEHGLPPQLLVKVFIFWLQNCPPSSKL